MVILSVTSNSVQFFFDVKQDGCGPESTYGKNKNGLSIVKGGGHGDVYLKFVAHSQSEWETLATNIQWRQQYNEKYNNKKTQSIALALQKWNVKTMAILAPPFMMEDNMVVDVAQTSGATAATTLARGGEREIVQHFKWRKNQ